MKNMQLIISYLYVILFGLYEPSDEQHQMYEL